MKRSTHAAEESTQAQVHMVLPFLRLVLLTRYVQRNGEKSCASLCLCMRVLLRLQNTVYANWQAIQGNNKPQARNDCDGEAAADTLTYASVVFGPEKMQQK